MSNNYEMTAIISDALALPKPGEKAMDSLRVADRLAAAGYSKPRTITTREEVEALPDGSVILDSAGDVANLRDGFWFSYETSPMTHHRMAKYTPATVLYTPKES